MSNALSRAIKLAPTFAKFPFKVVYEYFREFWYIRVGNKFQPSTKKFWAQVSQIIFVIVIGVKIFGSETLSARISDTLIISLMGHVAVAMSWYGYAKQGDIKASEARETANLSQVKTSEEG